MSDPPASADLLALANHFDREWHAQPRTYEREALTRLLQLMTLPARIVSPGRPARLIEGATILRNVCFTGSAVEAIFFKSQQYTEVDCIVFGLGSVLGHPDPSSAYVIEVERKSRDNNGDYYRAIRRARRICDLIARRFRLVAHPILVYDDRDGHLSHPTDEDGAVILAMSHLVEATAGLGVRRPAEIPGRASDRVMLKLDLLWTLAGFDPAHPLSDRRSVQGLIDAARRAGLDLRMPVTGHQDLDRFSQLDRWYARAEESPEHLHTRIDRALDELSRDGLLRRNASGPELTLAGSNVVLAYSPFRDGAHR